jgi:Dolichyl-phosphate-mannose-protein mannosyltransferase
MRFESSNTLHPPSPAHHLPPSWRWWAGAWLALNCVQAAFTNLAFDEAYYWLYSNHLDWGYFDHPPMTALLVRLGDPMGGTLGVRFGTILAQGGALWALWRMLARFDGPLPPPHIFFFIAFAIPVFQVYGFIATPDGPLLLFGALFLLLYQCYLEKPAGWTAVALGAVTAGLFYSKYHGLLLVFFVLLSNPRLLLNPHAWLVVATALSLFAPHLYWQVQHDWSSFKYHLVERAAAFKGRFVQEYLLNLLVIYNPLYLYPLYRVFKKRPQNDFERALYFVFFGFILFFAASSLRGHVQPQWMVLAALPIILLLSRAYVLEPGMRAWIRVGFWALLPLYLFARVAIARDLLPRETEFFEQRDVGEAMAGFSRETGIPWLFGSNYRYASAYAFYTRDPYASSVRGIRYRRSQFDLWGFEERYHDRTVWFLTTKNDCSETLTTAGGRKLYFNRIEKYQACDRVTLTLSALTRAKNDSINARSKNAGYFSADLLLKNPYSYDLYITPHESLTIVASVFGLKAAYPLRLVEADFEAFVLSAGESKKVRVYAGLPADLSPRQTWEIGFSLRQDQAADHPESNVLKTK